MGSMGIPGRMGRVLGVGTILAILCLPSIVSAFEPAVIEVAPSWYDLAASLADRAAIAEELARRGYEPPEEAHLLVGGVSKIGERPAYTWFSLGDTGFRASAESFWPASMVKLVAAVGALATLRGHGLTGSARVSFTDGRGAWSGPVSNLTSSALTHSNNVAYDRLMKIAGFDEINDRLLSAEDGFPFMAMQRAYDAANDPTLRISPEIAFDERGRAGTIPRRESARDHPQCPDDGNCATLFEMLHFLQRVVLHDELDERDRFDLHRADVRALRRCLDRSPTRIGDGVRAALRHPIVVYNKGGRVPDLVANDHALVVDLRTHRRYLVAASIRETGGKEATQERLTELVSRGVRAAVRAMDRGIPAGRDGGIPIAFAWKDAGEGAAPLRIDVAAEGELDALALYAGREEIARSRGEPLAVNRALPGEALDLYVAIARRGKKIVGYKTLGLAQKVGEIYTSSILATPGIAASGSNARTHACLSTDRIEKEIVQVPAARSAE